MIALFSEVVGGVAIVRQAPGILKQLPLFARRGQVFVKHAGGFVRISDKLGDSYLTVHPNLKVLELDGEGIRLEGNRAPSYELRV